MNCSSGRSGENVVKLDTESLEDTSAVGRDSGPLIPLPPFMTHVGKPDGGKEFDDDTVGRGRARV